MGLSQVQLRSELREHLGGIDNVELIDADADVLLNRSWWEIADLFNFREKETTRTYPTVIGTAAYASASDLEGLQEVSIEDINSQARSLLSPMSELLYESDFVNNTTSRMKPTNYVRRGTGITLWPTPDKAYTITEYYWKTLADIAAGGVTIPQAWHELILYGAVYRGFARAGDYNRSRAAKTMQMELMSIKETQPTKEKIDRPHAGVRVLRPRYP